MSRTVFVIRGGVAVDKATAPPLHHANDAPYVIADGMEAVQSMVDGRMYDSKRGYQASVRAAGCEIVGNDKAPFERKRTYEPQDVGRDMRQAIAQLESQSSGRGRRR